MNEVKLNDKVRVHYTGMLDNGNIFDSSKDRAPLEFKVGEGRVIRGFENAVMGMKVNESKKINIPSEQAYGPRHDELIQDIPKSTIPSDIDLYEGLELVSKQSDGSEIAVRVVGLDDDSVKIDANHPLAGQDLIFEIELVEIA